MYGTTVVSLEHARKSFGDAAVLKDISLSMNPGEVVAVIGPSGGGKSTLLRCLTLLETLDGGSLSYGDLEVVRDDGTGSVYAGKAVQKEAKARFGLVFQNFNLFPHYSVIKNVTDAPLHVQKRPKDEVFAHARSLLEKMGLSGKEDMVPDELSGGQQQRVRDRPGPLSESRGDVLRRGPRARSTPSSPPDVRDLIREMAGEQMAMVIVTHEMGFAREVADRIVFMDGGRVVEEGVRADAIARPQHDVPAPS